MSGEYRYKKSCNGSRTSNINVNGMIFELIKIYLILILFPILCLSQNTIHTGDPGLSVDYTPESTSPIIDKGTIIPNFSDGYIGSAPDIGAFEYDPHFIRERKSNLTKYFNIFPNPFNLMCNILISDNPKSGEMIYIYDIRGHLVSSLQARKHMKWVAKDFESGIYLIKYKGFTRRVLLIK